MVSVNFSVLPMAASRSLLSSVVICTTIPLNSLFCCRFLHYQPQFVGRRMVTVPQSISVQLVPPTSYFLQVPPPVVSSANQTCLVPVGCNSCISGIMPTAYTHHIVYTVPVKGHIYTIARSDNSALPTASWTCTLIFDSCYQICSYVTLFDWLAAVCI